MKDGKAIFIAAALFVAMLAAPGAGRAADDFSCRFLWPENLVAPGRDLAELQTVETGTGEEDTPIGTATVRTYSLRTPSGEAVAESGVMTFPGREGLTIFRTEIEKEIAAPTGKYETPHFALPAVRPDRRFDNVLDFVVEEFVTPVRYAVPTTGPVVMFTRNYETVVMSPLDHFMAAMQAPVRGEWRCGFGGLIEKVPAGTVTWTVLVTGQGVNDTFMKWGRVVQDWHGHKQVDPYADVTLSHLGYWTDNGSYYYYRTEEGMNYAETLLAVKAYADRERIPYAYFQIDSWWYPKAKINEFSSKYRGGCLLWEPIPEMFPQGLPALQRELGLPLVAHNRYCADVSPYCERYPCAPGDGGKKQGALPLGRGFWDEIMGNAADYGVTVYEQDWLYTHMAIIPLLRSDLHAAGQWYEDMAGAAEARGITMQLCMASPEFFLQQLKHNNATHARTSHDYKGGLPKAFFWMPFHKSSLFACAVGLWPFKDNFQSTAGQRPTYNIMPEANPVEEALVAALSGGPVGPSDAIGHSDRRLIMRACREDGILLKPDRPATPIDLMFLYNKNIFIGSKYPWVVTTESRHEAGATVYCAAFNLWPMSMHEPRVSFTELGVSGKHLVYNWRGGEHHVESETLDFGRMPAEEGFYYLLCPLLPNGMAVIGEYEKFITMSAKRFPEVTYENGSVVMTVEGAPGEEVKLAVYCERPVVEVSGAEADPASASSGVHLFRLIVPASGRAVVGMK